jgi:hypothetical protein
VLVVALTAVLCPPAEGEQLSKTLVIVDTGFDTTIPTIKDAVLFEVCILDWPMCPNGKNFQEGVGAASISVNSVATGSIAHGTQMASIAMEANPTQKLVLLRLIAYNNQGQRLPVYDSAVVQAFKWIQKKQTELNIGAVAMAQGHHSLLSGKNYCPKNIELEKIFLDLKLKNLPIFLPTGNAGDKSRIDWPACIPTALAIGAIDSKGEIASYSNYDRILVDFYTPGTASAILPGGTRTTVTGTSVSTLIAASNWMKVTDMGLQNSVADTAQLFRDASPIIFDAKLRYGRKMDLDAALLKLQITTKP